MDVGSKTLLFRVFSTLYLFDAAGDLVVKLMACGAMSPGFEPGSQCYDFRYWVSPASKRRYHSNSVTAT